MMATEMPAAMRPYSMAVAPDSSFTKRRSLLMLYSLIPAHPDSPAIELHLNEYKYDLSMNMKQGYRAGNVGVCKPSQSSRSKTPRSCHRGSPDTVYGCAQRIAQSR